MESKVIFQDGMDNDPADYNNLQDFAGRSFDHVVGDGITSERKFAGFQTTASGATTLATLPGRFYSGGKAYNAVDAFPYDFALQLPVAAKKVAVLVVWGEEVDTDTRPREFLINEDTGASEPRVVAMEHARVAKLSVSLGQENADPIPPVLDSGVTAVATIVLSPTGIESVTMSSDNALDSVQSVSDRVETLETFEASVGPQVQSLGADIAALTKGQASLVGLDTFGRVLDRVAVLESKEGIPEAAVDSFADFLVDESHSDTAFAGFQAKVTEGVRFDDEQAGVSALQLFDPLNPRAKVVGGVLFPAYNRTKRLGVGPKAGELQVSAYSYQVHNLVQKTASRHRVRHGPARVVSTASNWFKTGRFDVAKKVFRRQDEAWTTPAALLKNAVLNHIPVRSKGHWEDTYEQPYWEEVTVASAVNGTQVAETFLNANDMILDAVGLTFTRLAADGGITLAICETDRGLPLLDKVISTTTVDRASLVLNAESVIPVQPVFLTGGVRYAIVVITAADHWLATCAGASFPQGTLFYVLDGAYQQGDATKDIMFSLYQAQFTVSRAVIDLQPLSLAGGFSDIDILAPVTIPGSSQVSYEIQVGGTWYALNSAEGGAVLSAGGVMPNLVAFRAVLSGTPDVMPSVALTGSQVKVSRPRTTFTYMGATRNLAAPSTQLRLAVTLESFDAAHHTATGSLLTGATFATETAATSHSDATNQDGTITRTFVFNLGAGVSAFKWKLVGTTDSALNVFDMALIKDHAL
jgi:hypothetical protein